MTDDTVVASGSDVSPQCSRIMDKAISDADAIVYRVFWGIFGFGRGKVPFFLFLSLCTACGILVPQPGIEPGSSAMKVLSPSHWTSRNSVCVFKINFIDRNDNKSNNVHYKEFLKYIKI